MTASYLPLPMVTRAWSMLSPVGLTCPMIAASFPAALY
jgi:hypothetical protein